MKQKILDYIWEKGKIIPGRAPEQWRRDDYGRTMRNDYYGNRDKKHGWEVDHILPKAKGGGDELPNLRPLNWKSNAERLDEQPDMKLLMSAFCDSIDEIGGYEAVKRRLEEQKRMIKEYFSKKLS